MRHRFYYKKYEASKLATFISALQGSFWGAVAYAMIPALPLFILGINLDIPFLLILSGIIWIILIVFIMMIDTDKLAQKKLEK